LQRKATPKNSQTWRQINKGVNETATVSKAETNPYIMNVMLNAKNFIGRDFRNLSDVMLLKIGAEVRVCQLGNVKQVCEIKCGGTRKDEKLWLVFGEDVNYNDKVKCKTLLTEFEDRISHSMATIGKTDAAKMEIKLITQEPVACSPYWMPLAEKEVVTDCNALWTAFSKKDIIPRVGRWWLQVQEFDFDIKYRPGARMPHVDALSRYPITVEVDQVDITESDWILSTQLQDQKLARIRKILETGVENRETKQYFRDYVLKNNKIYRKLTDGRKVWAVPHLARWQIVRLCHDRAGHLSVEHTIRRILG
jgi:hypothetical protein